MRNPNRLRTIAHLTAAIGLALSVSPLITREVKAASPRPPVPATATDLNPNRYNHLLPATAPKDDTPVVTCLGNTAQSATPDQVTTTYACTATYENNQSRAFFAQCTDPPGSQTCTHSVVTDWLPFTPENNNNGSTRAVDIVGLGQGAVSIGFEQDQISGGFLGVSTSTQTGEPFVSTTVINTKPGDRMVLDNYPFPATDFTTGAYFSVNQLTAAQDLWCVTNTVPRICYTTPSDTTNNVKFDTKPTTTQIGSPVINTTSFTPGSDVYFNHTAACLTSLGATGNFNFDGYQSPTASGPNLVNQRPYQPDPYTDCVVVYSQPGPETVKVAQILSSSQPGSFTYALNANEVVSGPITATFTQAPPITRTYLPITVR